MKQRVWDLPTRVFHWALVALIAFSWWTAEEDHLEWHLWSGISILALLLFRILWGLVGSSTARFTSFVRGPRTVFGYLRGQWRGIGHNPLGALSVIALLALTSAQVSLGLFSTGEDGFLSGPLAHLVSADTSDDIRDLHEDLFDVLVIFIALHVAAALFYWVFARKNLVKPMITGFAELDPEATPMRPGKWWVAAICLIAAIAMTRWVVAGAPPLGT